jgi:DNA-binding NarL/FixJ family response regulator
VVALSAARENPDIWKAYQGGANSYLLKAAPPDELRTMLKGIFAYWSVLNAPPKAP